MTSWSVIVLISLVGVIGLSIYNIRSLIRKWKNNPGSWVDLLMGILIWGAGIAALVYIFIQQLKV
jgi:hypothetical protein